MYSKEMKNSFLLTLIFLPIFFTPTGIYTNEKINGIIIGEDGLVLPGYFFIGVILAIFSLYKFIKKGEITYISKEIKIHILVISFIGFSISSIGMLIYSDFIIYLKFFQILTGFSGVFISWYLFEYKKINIKIFFGHLGITYFIIILLNFSYSISKVGLSSFGPGLLPSTGLFDIYQTLVYYPFIVNLIYFMSLPYVMNKYKKFFYIYSSIYILYLLSMQVRGAILSFMFMFIIVYIYKFKLMQKIVSLVFFGTMFIIFIFSFGIEIIVGKFANIENVKSFSGRTDIWISLFENYDTKKLLFGTLFYKGELSSAHNQYLELLVMGGVVFLVFFILVFLNLFFLLVKTLNNKMLEQKKDIVYYILILCVLWAVDFNVNVPMSNTTPAIVYWFYLNSVFVLYYLSKKTDNSKY